MTVFSIDGRKTALLSDIHSNYPAFRACYEDAIRHGADSFIFLGDYISDLADVRRTMALLYEIRETFPTVFLRGNRERYMLENRAVPHFRPGSKTGSLLYTYSRLEEQDLDFFQALPEYAEIRLNGIPVEIAHAVKGDDRFYFEQEDPQIAQVFSQMRHSLLLTGHCHKQYIQHSQGKTIIKPGSVGVPRDYGYLTQYALLETEAGTVRCGLRQIPYDLAETIHAQFESGLTEIAPCWAISVLYDVITGEEYTLRLLEQVSRSGSVYDEDAWRRAAAAMGLRFTEGEILDFSRSVMG